MKSLRSDQVFFAFSPDLPPLLEVGEGEEFVLETCDCFSNQLLSDDDTLDNLDWDRINPATGPVAVTGVEPGDIVRIDLKKLELAGPSVMTTIPGAGAIGGIRESSTRVMDNGGGFLRVPTERGELRLAVRPMIGVIGVAPAQGSIPNGTPGTHGGNMDCNLIGEGASLYLRCGVAGALFGLGDAHALMGDGEVLVCGAETPAKVTLSISAVETDSLPTPFIETPELYAAVASAPTSDEALRQATDNMFTFLTAVAGLSEGDAGRLMSLVGHLKFCQVVDPEITIRFEFPRSVLKELGFEGI